MVMLAPQKVDTDGLLDITLHDNQLKAYKSNKRITVLVSGIQGGKTVVGGLWANRRYALHDRPHQNFIVAAPTFKLMVKSTLPWSLHLLRGCGWFEKKYFRFHLNGGGTIWFASMQDDDSCEGATNVQGIWIDEAGKIRYQSWINLLARSSFLQCPIMITTTPYSLNWLYEDIYKPWKAGDRDDIELVQFRSVDNPHFPKAEYELQKKNLDSRVFQRKYGGTFQRMAGLVYPDFDKENVCDEFNYNRSRYFVCGGVDFGWNNPFAVSVRALALDGSYDYQIAEFSKSYVSMEDRIDVLRQFKKAYGIKTYYCDSEDPAQINMFQNAGLPAVAVDKGPGSVSAGIVLHNELIKSNRHKIFKKCRHTANEYATYHYPEDTAKEKNATENPVDKDNHLMDCNRYVTMETEWLRIAAAKRNSYQKWTSPAEKLKIPSGDNGGDISWYERQDEMTVI